uniref:Helicase ATP-binding domain-containing protein n=1 Tax=Globisporangium ultimum (strain ATCC 200006 / CBS 805.95 / DAOM BR144) TaxID=431595 RepID=K3WRY7_GLOUD
MTTGTLMERKSVLAAEALPREQLCDKIRAVLLRFGIESLRGQQGPVLQSVLQKSDTLVLMPTGGEKALCFQLPGLVIIVGLLLALMIDQVEALRHKRIGVEILSSLASTAEKLQTHQTLMRQCQSSGDPNSSQFHERIELPCVTPESRATIAIQRLLTNLSLYDGISLFAIDEAYCISTWDHDFCPTHRQLGDPREVNRVVDLISDNKSSDNETKPSTRYHAHSAATTQEVYILSDSSDNDDTSIAIDLG